MRAFLRKELLAVMVLAFFLTGCGERTPPPSQEPFPLMEGTVRTQRPYQISGIWYYPIPTAAGYVEEGLASWYGPGFHGKPPSTGERYDMHAMTAAHKTLPMGTHVKVTNLENGRSTLLRINDRGPFVEGRIIDLSRAAARELDTKRQGLARVRVEAVQLATEERQGTSTHWRAENVPSLRYGNFTIQIGSFKDRSNAHRLQEAMRSGNQVVHIQQALSEEGTFFRVQVGKYRDLMLAEQERQRLRSSGFRDAFVVAMEDR